MIKVSIKDCADNVSNITIEGHSGYAPMGHDIVCASVSTLVITSVNMIIRLDKDAIHYVARDGFISVDVIKHSEFIDIVVQNMISLLDELANDYKKYIKIIK